MFWLENNSLTLTIDAIQSENPPSIVLVLLKQFSFIDGSRPMSTQIEFYVTSAENLLKSLNTLVTKAIIPMVNQLNHEHIAGFDESTTTIVPQDVRRRLIELESSLAHSTSESVIPDVKLIANSKIDLIISKVQT